MIFSPPQASERENAEAEMHQALKALDHHQEQLDLAEKALQAASLEVAEAKDKKKMLEKEHGRFDDLMENTKWGRKNCFFFFCVVYLVFDMCVDY